MSISLFNAISDIKVMNDAGGAPQFKRADLGRFLGIVDMPHTFDKIATKSRSKLSESKVKTITMSSSIWRVLVEPEN